MLFEPFAVELASRLDVSGDATVLELACGTGICTRAVADALPSSVRLVATDLNDPMLRVARAKLGDRAAWAIADASALPFAAQRFDAVVCQFGLMFVPDKIGTLRQVRRVLRPNGSLAFNVWDAIETNQLQHIAHTTVARLFGADAPNFYEVPFGMADRGGLATMLTEAGFDPVTLDDVGRVGECATAREAAVGLIYGNPIITAIRQRGTVEADAVVDAIAATIAAECGNGPRRARMQAVVVTARPK